MIGAFVSLDDLPVPAGDAVTRYDRAELTRRQVAAGQTLEDLELILSPMVDGAKEAIGSMGDDTPLAVISDKPRLISQFFRQNFSQVTNPPIDPLRERHVMSLKTRFGNLANILDTEDRRDGVLVLESPVLSGTDWARLRAHFGPQGAEIDCTFSAGGGPETLRAAIARIRAEAVTAVRQGRTELFLTDMAIGEDRIGIAGVLAAAAVHTHLVRTGLRSYASINIQTAESLDTHYYAVLIGVGATTVHAYLAEASIVDRHARGLFGALTLADCLARHRLAVDEGHRGYLELPRRLQFRGGRAFPRAGQRSLPGYARQDFGRGLRLAASQRRAAPRRGIRPGGGDTAGRRFLSPAPYRRDSCLLGAADSPSAERRRHR